MNKLLKSAITFSFIVGLFLITPSFTIAQAPNPEAPKKDGECVVINIPGAIIKSTPPPGCESVGGGGAPKVVELARQQVGKPYVWGAPSGRNWAALDPEAGKTPGSFDCSGLVGWAWYWGTGGNVSMAGQTSADWGSGKFEKHQPGEPMIPGDLVYYSTPSNIHHVALFAGTGNCGTSDCIIETYTSSKPAREISLAQKGGTVVGFLRPTTQ